jgi:hypothetical protein
MIMRSKAPGAPAHDLPTRRPSSAALVAAALATLLVAPAATAGSATATTATLPVKVFNYPGLNNPVGNLNCSNENQNLIEIIDALEGYSVDGQLQSFGGSLWLDGTKPEEFTVEFFAEQLDEAVFFIMTDMETVSPTNTDFYPEAARVVLREWVEAGGVLLMTGTSGSADTDMLNLTFDWDLTTEFASSWTKNPEGTAGTPFDDVDAPTLPNLSATDAIGSGTVPGFTAMWGDEDNATVAVIERGEGKVIFLGFDFFDTGLDSSAAGDGSGSVCGQNDSVWVQEVLPAAMGFARELSLDRIPEELRRELGLGGPAPAADTTVTDVVSAATRRSAGLSGTEALLVRGDTVVPIAGTIDRTAGPGGGVVIADEASSLRVTVAANGASETAGVVVAPDGEIVCEICAQLAAGSIVEAWILSTPRLAAAVQVEVDIADGVCPLLRIPVGAPLDGGGAIEPGAHTLQLRMYTQNGFEVLAVPITVGGVVPTSIPAGAGGVLADGVLGALLPSTALLAAVLGLGALTAARGRRRNDGAIDTIG